MSFKYSAFLQDFSSCNRDCEDCRKILAARNANASTSNGGHNNPAPGVPKYVTCYRCGRTTATDKSSQAEHIKTCPGLTGRGL